jgi:hypothetical protein
MHANLPNDLYNGFRRELSTPDGSAELVSPPEREQVAPLGEWACLEGSLGWAGIYGADGLMAHRVPHRRGGKFPCLYVDEICYRCDLGTRAADAGSLILDVGWAALASVSAADTRRFAEEAQRLELPPEAGALRAVALTGLDGVRYVVAANLGDGEVGCAPAWLLPAGATARDLVGGQEVRAEAAAPIPLARDAFLVLAMGG